MMLKSCFCTRLNFWDAVSCLWNKANNIQRSEQGSATEELQQGSPRLLVMALLNKAVIRNSFSLLGGPAWRYTGVVTEVLLTLSDYFWNMHAVGTWALLAEPGLVMDCWALWVLVRWLCAVSGSSRESQAGREGLLLGLWASRSLVAFDKFFISPNCMAYWM